MRKTVLVVKAVSLVVFGSIVVISAIVPEVSERRFRPDDAASW
jgi:hypothetical protein